MSELAKALAEVQANLPAIVKGETAKVETKTGGSYSYTYADLADISEQLLPLLTKHGLSFAACPHLRDDGQFVLRYALLHTSGEERGGDYPLPLQGGPQAQGSAITYARRYVVCATTGVAPEDDDGRAAQQASQRQGSEGGAGPDPKRDAPSSDHIDGLVDEMAVLNKVIDEARAAGVEGDYDATREWAWGSVDNARTAAGRLRKAIAEKGAAA